MDKRAQVAFFAIIAIILVTGVALFFYIKDIGIKKEAGISQAQLSSIKGNIQDCVELVATDAIRLLGLQGGYIIPPPSALETNFSTISYGYYLGKKVLPSIARMQDEIDIYVELFLPFCTDFTSYPDVNIKTGKVTTKSKIGGDFVLIEVNWPITLSKGESRHRLEKYEAKIPIRLGKVYDVVDGIIEREIEDTKSIELTYLLNTDMDVAILPYNNKNIIYSVTDLKEIDGETYTFMFANRLR